MSVAYRRDPTKPENIFVANIVLCKGVPFYGYHVGWKPFLKIYLLNPAYMSKFSDLLRNGLIMGTSMQPYESHIPYHSQFLTDFNLYGCGWLNVSAAYFRDPIFQELEESKVPLAEYSGPRISYCSIEVDITADLIENRYEIKHNDLHANFAERLLPFPADLKNLSSMEELWNEDAVRRHEAGLLSHRPPQDFERTLPDVKWSNENILKEKLQNRVFNSLEEFKAINPESEIVFDSYLRKDDLLESIPNTYDVTRVMFLPEKHHQDSRVCTDYLNVNEFDIDEEVIIADESTNGHAYSSNDTVDTILGKRPSQLSSFSAAKRTKSFTSSTSKKNSDKNSDFSYFSQEFEDSIKISDSQLLLLSQDNTSLASSHGQTLLLDIITKFRLSDTVSALRMKPPSAKEVDKTIEDYGLPKVEYKEPYFSHESDVPKFAMIHAGIEYRLKTNNYPSLPNFEKVSELSMPFDNNLYERDYSVQMNSEFNRTLQYLPAPPTKREVAIWLQRHENEVAGKGMRALKGSEFLVSQIAAPTQKMEFKYTSMDSVKNTASQKIRARYMSVMALEVHVNTRDDKMPNPKHDAITAVFWRMQTDEPFDENPDAGSSKGIVVFDAGNNFEMPPSTKISAEIAVEYSEVDLINKVIDLVRELDPDILAGYEVNGSSWGYLIERAQIRFEYDLCNQLSRVKHSSNGQIGDKWGMRHTSGIKITGRHMINIWRMLRQDLNLLQYTMENVVFNIFHLRIPQFSHEDLTFWFKSNVSRNLEIVMRYYLDRVEYDVKIIEHQELIARYSEQARLIGIDYYSVFYRGSQFKVESFLARLAKKENFIMISPSKKQVGQQNALEHIPLVMEPETKFYTSPVLVLDFQSLYPSIIIAYNYCYSTCLGRITPWRGKNKLGVVPDLELPPGLLELIKSEVEVAPNGLVYAKPSLRKSLLAKILTEILATRVMIKDGMKMDKDDIRFQKSMNNRQLALKLTANVTYGYTSATYSGRMPCSEIADSIVLSARETLERAIEIIRTTKKWGAEVVYGDTDSLFVYLPGKSKDQAFDIGNEIAAEITKMNPAPVKLKFEKVYHPCILLTKKRYVGYMYECKDQAEPVFDAKGIETVRRDGTPAEQKIEEKALRILFETADLSKVKQYLEEQWKKIMIGNVSIQDFCFAKEVKLGTYKEGGLLPPGAAISTKRMEQDERAEPQYKERVPYVVLTGAPGARLIDRCFPPEHLLENISILRIDAEYYITKNIIPPLERLFNLMGANIRAWYDDMPKVIRYHSIGDAPVGSGLRQFMKSAACIICGNNVVINNGDSNSSNVRICSDCKSKPLDSFYSLQLRLKKWQKSAVDVELICRNCTDYHFPATDPNSRLPPLQCISGDCPIYYTRKKAVAKLRQAESIDLNAIDW